MSASTVMDRAGDDERLIRDGDHARLLEPYRYPIFQRVRLKVPERDVDDVVSEVILFLYRELACGKTYSVPFGVVVARRTGWMIAEYHERKVPVPHDLAEADLGSAAPGDVSDHGYVRRLLAELPPRDRDVAQLAFSSASRSLRSRPSSGWSRTQSTKPCGGLVAVCGSCSMGDRLIELFEEYVASVARGEQPDAVEYVARAGDERDKLEALIDEFLAEAAPREPSDEAVAMMRAWIEQEPPLLELRRRRRLRRADVVGALVERLGLDPRKREKVEDYYHELEVGQLDASRVDQRVFAVLGDVLGVRLQDVQSWPRRAAGVDVEVAYRSSPGESPAAMPNGPRAEAGDPDEVDELFLGPVGH